MIEPSQLRDMMPFAAKLLADGPGGVCAYLNLPPGGGYRHDLRVDEHDAGGERWRGDGGDRPLRAGEGECLTS